MQGERHHWYRLDGKTPVPVSGAEASEAWRQDRHVARDEIDGVTVSTVFLSLDHGYGDEPPVLFETLVVGGPFDQSMDRYHTWDEAEAGHAAWCEKVRHPPFFWLGKDALP